jgi:exodeoxyribonuclease VII small subunit
MKKELTYSEAFAELEKLVGQLEEGDIQLDKLTTKVKQANDLIRICEAQLRSIDNEVKVATMTTPTKLRKKNGR